MVDILVLNNRDSFVFNLLQLLNESGRSRATLFNGEDIPCSQLDKYQGILLSPGPGTPREAPALMSLIDRCANTHSLLGICLGHQAIAEYYGARLSTIAKPLHGHSSSLRLLEPKQALWQGLAQGTQVGRYHSWQVEPQSLPDMLAVSAVSQEDNCIMALRHTKKDLFGLQFHPESIISERGKLYVENWLEIVEKRKAQA